MARPRKPESEKRPDRAYRPMPVDFMLLAKLPEKGMIGGVHWKGRLAAHLQKEMLAEANGELTADMIPMSFVTSRLRSMAIAGYTVNYPAAGNAAVIWARTDKGTELLGRKEEVLGT